MSRKSAVRLDGSYDTVPIGMSNPFMSGWCPGGAAFMIYSLAQAALCVLALTLPLPAASAVSLFAAAIGASVLVASIVRLKPKPSIGWWFVTASSLSIIGAGIIAAVMDGLGPSITAPGRVPSLALVALSLPLLAGGLALLGRRRTEPAGTADALDATMVTAGTVLLIWMFASGLADPLLTEMRLVTTVILPFGLLLVFAAMVKLALSGGLRVTATALVGMAAAVLLGATVDLLVPAIHAATVIGDRVTRLLWTIYSSLLGAAALHPSFAHAMRGIAWGGTELSGGRVVLFALTAVVVPLALALGLIDKPATFDRSPTGIAIPTAAAATVLLALVGRLALIVRFSQQRAVELASRSTALMDAMEKQEVLRQELAYRAMHDPLTGLPNRVVLAERLETALSRAGEGGNPALLLLDLDGFKDVNDSYGHPMGDELLASVSHRLLTVLTTDAVVARLGGDEFAILFETSQAPQALAQAKAVLDAIRQPFVIDEQELFLSISIGLLIVDPSKHPVTPSDALRDADLALYEAKSSGRNRVVTFEPRLRAKRLERIRISAGLRRALNHGELQLDYQPIVDLSTGEIFAVEALARWRPPEGDVIPPAQFIPIAEATGLINAVGSQILRKACEDARRWHADYGVAISVNVSGQQLADPGFADMVTGVLADTGMPGTGLILELTENSLVETSVDQPEVTLLRQLRGHGIRIAIDDFGTGYSSLAYISELPVDIVKLDRSFAEGRNIPTTNRPNWAFTGAILEAISSVGLKTIAEGIETFDQAKALHSAHCDFAQGYLFFQPVPPACIDQILAQPIAFDTHAGAPGRHGQPHEHDSRL